MTQQFLIPGYSPVLLNYPVRWNQPSFAAGMDVHGLHCRHRRQARVPDRSAAAEAR